MRDVTRDQLFPSEECAAMPVGIRVQSRVGTFDCQRDPGRRLEVGETVDIVRQRLAKPQQSRRPIVDQALQRVAIRR